MINHYEPHAHVPLPHVDYIPICSDYISMILPLITHMFEA